MILHRVIEHVKAQNWTALALDFVIVVTGVFIGIQVSNWNAGRQERALEHQYLERLHADFARSIENAEQNITAMERQYLLEGLMLEKLRSCTLSDSERSEFAQGIYLVGRLEPPPLDRGTLDELRSAGRMGILTSAELRTMLEEVSRLQQRNSEVLNYIIARATPHITYIDARVVLLQPPGGFTGVNFVPEPERVLFDFPALCADPYYLGAVSALQEVTRVVISQNKAGMAGYQALLAVLGQQLGQGLEAAR